MTTKSHESNQYEETEICQTFCTTETSYEDDEEGTTLPRIGKNPNQHDDLFKKLFVRHKTMTRTEWTNRTKKTEREKHEPRMLRLMCPKRKPTFENNAR